MASADISAWVAAADSAMIAVTATAGGETDGCLVGFHSQASIEPARYVVWLSNENHTSALAAAATVLGVHLLAEDQLPLARRLGGVTMDDQPDKLAGIELREEGGARVLSCCSAWFVGRVVDRFDGGDHRGFLLDPVVSACPESYRPLRLGAAVEIDAGHPAD